MRNICATQLPIETIVTPVGKSVPALDLQTDIIFGGNGSLLTKTLRVNEIVSIV